MKFLSQEVLEVGKELYISDLRWFDTWHLNAEAHLFQLAGFLIGVLLDRDGGNASAPRVLLLIDLLDGRVHLTRTILAHHSDDQVALVDHIRELEVGALFHPEASCSPS